MSDFLSDWYLWIKSFHIMAVLAWMAGLFYLPRLFVYHTMAQTGGEASELMKVMEYKLFRYIMSPAMYATWAAGLALAWIVGFDLWLYVKLAAVLAMTAFHFLLRRHLLLFREERNERPEKYFRVINEIPTVLMIIIVIMAVAKPF